MDKAETIAQEFLEWIDSHSIDLEPGFTYGVAENITLCKSREKFQQILEKHGIRLEGESVECDKSPDGKHYLDGHDVAPAMGFDHRCHYCGKYYNEG